MDEPKLVVIGAFECPERSPFPSHLPPIIAENGCRGFRRIFYNAEFKAVEVPGSSDWKDDPREILKPISAVRTDPISYQDGDQVVYLGKGKILVTSSILLIFCSLVPHILSRRWRLALRTLVNSWA